MNMKTMLLAVLGVVLPTFVTYNDPTSAEVFQAQRQAKPFAVVDPNPTTVNWAWLEDTYWYVPLEYLEAIVWNTSEPRIHLRASDQTVWHIKEYRNGYIFGPIAIVLENLAPPSCSYLIGSVTPPGKVNISFTPLPSSSDGNPIVTTGIGEMVKIKPANWTFNMQMSTPIPNSGSDPVGQIAHMAFMEQCTPDDDCWRNLPGVGENVVHPPQLPNMLEECGFSNPFP